MKKITFLLTLFLLFAGVGVAQTAAKYYKPGERKTAFAAGDKVFIYNAARPGGDRTGLLRKTSANKVGFYRDCKPGAGLFSTENSGLIWEIKSVTAVEDAENVYELTIASVPGGQYIGIDGNTTYEAGQTLTVQTFFNYEHKGNSNFEAADGTVVTPTAENKDVWAVYDPERRKTDYEDKPTNEKLHHGCWNGNGTQFDEWEAAHPYVFYSIENADEDLAALKNTYNANQAALNTTIGTFTEASFTLTTDNLTSNAGSTNSTWGDNGGIPNLIDGNTGTHFHTQYDSEGPNPNAFHNLMVDLGDEASQMFRFAYITRDHQNNAHPSVIRIWGSENGTDFTEISVLTSADGLVNASKASYESPIISADRAYRYIRLDVEDTYNTLSKKTDPAGYKFFALAEFSFKTVSGSPAAGVLLKNALAVRSKTDALTFDFESDIIVPAAAREVAGKFASLVAAAAVPFEYSTASAPVYYAIKADRGDNYYWTLKYQNSGKVKVETEAAPIVDACKYWFFTLSENNYVRIVPMLSPAASLGYTNAGAGAGKLTNVGTVIGNEYEYVSSGNTNYPVAFKLAGQTSAMYLSNIYGKDNFMGLYGVLNDGGTRLKLEPLDSPEHVDDLVAIYNVLSTQFVPAGATVGSAIGQFTVSDQTAYSNGVNALTDVTGENIPAVAAAISGVTVSQNLPVKGKLYRFKGFGGNGNNKYMTSDIITINNNKTPERLQLSDAGNTRESVFYWNTDGRLVDYKKGYCLGTFNADHAWAVYLISETAKVGTVTFEAVTASDAYGSFAIHPTSGRTIYNNYSIDGTSYVDCGGANTGAGYRWTIEDVNYLPVYISEVGYSTLYSPVALQQGDGGNKRVTAYTGTISANGEYLELTEITGNIPANTPVVIQYAEGGAKDETTGCVYLPVADNAEAAGDHSLSGTFATIAKPEGDNILTLQMIDGEVGFYTYTGTELGGFKAYLALSAGTAVNGLRFADGGTTGVEGAVTVTQKKETFYDLNGRPVAYPTKGIYVTSSGKKVLFK